MEEFLRADWTTVRPALSTNQPITGMEIQDRFSLAREAASWQMVLHQVSSN